jgi:hypothetical protein
MLTKPQKGGAEMKKKLLIYLLLSGAALLLLFSLIDGIPQEDHGQLTAGELAVDNSPDGDERPEPSEMPEQEEGRADGTADSIEPDVKETEPDSGDQQQQQQQTNSNGANHADGIKAEDQQANRPAEGQDIQRSDHDAQSAQNQTTVLDQSQEAESPQSDQTDQADAAAKEQTPVIKLTIIGPTDMGTVLDTETEYIEGETVLDVLKRVTRERRIQMAYRGRNATAYVEGINSVYEFDYGAESGWLYSVNGHFPNRSAGIWDVEAGDHIRWLYTVDLGRDWDAYYLDREEEK